MNLIGAVGWFAAGTGEGGVSESGEEVVAADGLIGHGCFFDSTVAHRNKRQDGFSI